jgi:CHAT domain-containing protein/tetratricopeptide (TPR) repeat protein
MLRCFVALVLATSAAGRAAPSAEDPRAVVAAATRAVEGDSAARLRARWSARLKSAPKDRAALLGLATIARLQYDYPLAENTYARLTAGPADRFTLYAYLGLADGYDTRSLNRDVRKQLDLALTTARALADPVGEADALLGLAFTRGRLEGVAVAEAILDSASKLIPSDAFDLRARLHGRWAITNALRARTAEASREVDTAIESARRARGVTLEANAFRMKGQILQYRGQWDSALVALYRSDSLYLRARNRSDLAGSLIWHAQVLGSQGRYGEMRDVMQRALTEGEATNNPGAIGDAYRAFGVLAELFGDWPAAAKHFKHSLGISTVTGDSSGMQTTSKYLAQVALAAGDVATAKRISTEALEQARRQSAFNTIYESARALANIAQREGDRAGVTRLLDEARAQLPRLPGAAYRLWLLHDDARHALTGGDLAKAAQLFESFLAGESGSIGPLLRFDARVRLADVYARSGDIARAERELTGGTDEIERWRAGLTDAQLRTSAFQIVATVDAGAFEPDAIAASTARVVAAIAQAGRVENAFALTERWRARDLADRLVRASAVRSSTPMSSASQQGAARPQTAREIAQALPDDRVALLEYFAVRGAPVTLFVIQRNRIEARVLPVDSLAQRVSRFRALIESGADASRVARALGNALVEPALSVLDSRTTRLVIVPDGPLHRLPFDALRLADGKYLVERFSTGFAPSASVLAGLWARRPGAQESNAVRILALGDPATSTSARGTARAASTAVFLTAAEVAAGLPRLKGAAREAKLVARYAPSADVRVGRAATAAFLKRTDLKQYNVLHFATHAIVDEKSVAGTALALAPGDGEDGFLGVGDLAALRLSADLVVLSACSTAGGVITGTEGVQGLTSALLQAGARSILATGWRIPDKDVVPLVEGFYSGLSTGLPVADALRAAKLQALRSGAQPRTWAGFVAVGDPLVVVPVKKRPFLR